MSLLKVALFAVLAVCVRADPGILVNPLAYSYSTPYGSLAYGAPVVARAAYASPVVAKTAYATPVAAAYAAPVAAAYAAPVATAYAAPAVVAARAEPYDVYPQYSYGYNVHDALTGDSKTQEETREGDVVRGSYSLIEADGSRRIVNYYADPITGFNAVVSKDAPVVAPVLAARAVVAPSVAYPATYAAPVAYNPTYAAPVAPVAAAVATPVVAAAATPVAEVAAAPEADEAPEVSDN